ncbi:MAG: indole-3-glycerol phosphate synthase TrpC [Fusobacteria bacterium]|nr:indole-3-glycerol phosphate synthase TrpC [Fusobacteriota bacterium]
MILNRIVSKKKETLKLKNLDIDKLKELVKDVKPRKSFYDAMKKDGLSIIGEVKKASPSKGIISHDFQPINVAKQYGQCVDAISVLTEEDFFMGHVDYLKEIRNNVDLPLLRKDFIIEESMIYESKVIGASAILLIASILELDTLKKFLDTAHSIGLDALVEVHTKEELEKVLKTEAKIIGINNRNLNTFDVNLERTLELTKYIPKNKIIVSESGIDTKEDILKLNGTMDAILVGESFMRTDNIIEKANLFKSAYKKV